MAEPNLHNSASKAGEIKRSLVLAGGGVRLAYHAGVLIALEEEGLHFSHVDGTSGGIFGTAMLASGITPYEAASRWRQLKLKSFMSVLPLKDYRSQYSLPAIGSATGIRKEIFPSLGIDIKKINSNTQFAATFNVCNFSTKTIEAIPQETVTEDHLIAGMSLPVFMPAVAINGQWYTDAVWIKDANLMEAVNRGADEIWLVWCIGNTPEYRNGFFNQYVHMIEISANGGLFAEIEWLRQINRQRQSENKKPIPLYIIRPGYPLPLDPDFFLDKINADTLINIGYADTKQYLQQKKEFDAASAPWQATAMESPGVTLHFRQQFHGSSTLKAQPYAVLIQLSFFVREKNNNIVWQQFSSISVDEHNFISGYHNQVTAGKGGIKASFDFIFNQTVYTAQLEFHFENRIHFFIGLDSKTARVIISEKGSKGKETIFIQPAVNRLKNALHANVNAEAGWLGKFRYKKGILKNLFK